MTELIAIVLAPFVLAWLASCVVAVIILAVAVKGRFTR
jgi:hypothetical protein